MRINNTNLPLIEQRLSRCGSRWSPRSGRWRCPAHRDWGYSLSIRLDSEGGIRLDCTAGCSQSRILTATGLDWFDLAAPHFTPDAEGRRWTT